MNYFVKRGEQQYGPYTLADLQLFTQQGHIAPTDLGRSEAMEDWLPVSQIIGNIAMPTVPGTGYGAVQQGTSPVPTMTGNIPPNLQWGILLALSIVTCSLFGVVWSFIQATYVRKIRPESRALLYLCLYGVSLIAWVGLAFGSRDVAQFSPFIRIVGAVLYLSAAFSMKSFLEDYYNSEENIGLHLSGVMTFFFSVYYFQYHFNRINDWKRTGVLQPQN
jgi:hypothetical protein